MLSKLAKGKRFDGAIINLIVLGCCVAAVGAANDGTTLLTNLAVLFLMYVFLRNGLGNKRKQTPGMYSLRSLTYDLRTASERMRGLDEPTPDGIREILCPQEEELFENATFKTTMKEYFDESDALVRRGKSYYSCNIADYVNEDLLNKVGNTSFNDFLSGVMTGLGILGTFVGLAIGLQSFRTDTAEAMTNSIAPLIEGIKVAFYTSIFGVLLSLVYGTLYKYRFNQAEAAVEEFVSVFYRYGGYRPENEAISRFLQLQEEQTDSMNQFAEEISIALADAIRDTLAPTLTQLPEQMSQAIQSNISPTMQAIGDSIQTLAGELTQNLVQAQSTGVESIVNNFLDQMDRAVGGQMANLENSIKTICEWEQETSKKLGEVVESVCENAESVAVINEDLKDIVKQLAAYIANMEAAADKLQGATEKVEQLAEKTTGAANEYQEILDGAAQISEQISKQQKEAAEFAEKQTEQVRVITEYVQVRNEQLKQTTENFNNAAERFATVGEQLSNDVGTAMTRTYAQFDSQLAKAITHFSGTLAELRDLVEKTPKIVGALSTSMKNDVAEYLGAVQKSQAESVETIQNETDALTKKIQKLDGVLNIMLLKAKEEAKS